MLRGVGFAANVPKFGQLSPGSSRQNVSSKLVSPVGDRVVIRFGQRHPLGERMLSARLSLIPQEAKFYQAEAEAYGFLSRHKNKPDSMIAALEEMGVAVRDADKDYWAFSRMRRKRYGAIFIMPGWAMFPEQSKPPLSPPPRKELDHTYNDYLLQVQGQPFIVVDSKKECFYNGLTHEVVHLFQALNGLPLAGRSADEDNAAALFDYLMDAVSRGEPLPSLEKVPPLVAQSLIIRCSREQEAHDFMRAYGRELGLSQAEVDENHILSAIYGKMIEEARLVAG